MQITAIRYASATQSAVNVTLADGTTLTCPWPCRTWHAERLQRWLDDGGVIAPAEPPAAEPDRADVDNTDKALKALGLVLAAWTNHTPAQLKAAFRQAWNSLS
jgi:hypothetical protein